MKKLTLLFLIGVGVLFFLLTAFYNADSRNKYVTMCVFEVYGAAKIVIAYEDGKTEELALNRFVSKNFVSNTKIINDAINGLSIKGYELLSVSGTD